MVDVSALPNFGFCDDYRAARALFLRTAANAGFAVDHHQHTWAKGPDDQPLFFDVAQKIVPNAPLFTIISGTHGPEGYAGSALQSQFLNSGEYGGASICLIHAHNPYGFAWDRRFNEDNIDLNRNYLPDFSSPPINHDYEKLRDFICPQTQNAQDRSADIAHGEAKLLRFGQEFGWPRLQAAISSGQYRDPKGLYFGGNGPSWSARTMKEILAPLLRATPRAIILDIHTGLGPAGGMEIILEEPKTSKVFQAATKIFGDHVKTTDDGSSVSSALSGTFLVAAQNWAPQTPMVPLAIEFGTIEPGAVFAATRESAWDFMNPDIAAPLHQEIRQQSKAAFYPQDDVWREKIANQGQNAIEKAIGALLDPFW